MPAKTGIKPVPKPPQKAKKTPPKKAKSTARSKGARGEYWVAERHATVWPTVKRRRSPNWGERRSDLEDEGTGICTEVKKRAGAHPWPAFLEKALDQAKEYAATRVDPTSSVVVLVGSPGPGHPTEARVYMDHAEWLDREAERAMMERLPEEMGTMVQAAQPVAVALKKIMDDEEVEIDGADMYAFLEVFRVN